VPPSAPLLTVRGVRHGAQRPGRPDEHRADRTGAVIPLRPPAWEWSFLEDGALALDSHELWHEPEPESDEALSQTAPRRGELKPTPRFVTVARMPPRAPRGAGRAKQRRSSRRVRRFSLLTIVLSVVVITLVLTAFGSGAPASITNAPSPSKRLLPDGPPQPQIIALQGPLRLQVPVAQSRVTAIGFHAAENGALPLEPLGRQGNRGLIGRVVDRIFGGDTGGLVYYRLEGGRGPSSAVLVVGAAPDTDVFSPVEGTVTGITDFVLDGKRRGVRIDIQPTSAPSLVVSVTRLRPDPALTVGSAVVAAGSRIGTVLDLSRLERQALARYTQDAGNHVSIEVHPAAAATLALP
jgi:hypothetical protein